MDHRYMWPPPPPPPQMPASAAADPYQRPPPPVPPPSNQPWTTYSTPQQFHYHPQPHHSPPPPPHWVAPPPSSDHSQYPPPPPLPPPPPYAHQTPPYPGNPQYPPPRPPHVAQPYPQDWGSGSWSQHQSWQYPNNSNEEDWASKARAWAAAKAATDNQQPRSQFVPAARPEGQHHFHNQFSQPVDPQFSDVHRPLAQASSYEQYPVEMGPPNRSGLGHSEEAHYSSSGQSSYAADIHSSYVDGIVAGNLIAPFSQHDKSSLSPSVHQQEVPSSYSSHAGYDPDNRYEGFNSSSSQPVSQHHIQPLTSASGRSEWMEEPNHLQGSQRAESLSGLSDQPLNFAPHFNRNLDPHVQPNYTHSSGGLARAVDPAAMSSNYAWPPSSASGIFYPPATTKMSSGPQVDHPTAVTPVSGHPTTMFPTGPGFHPNVPMTGATFGIGSGVTPHPTAFSGDPYGVSSMSERPKKASMPNWLREEIIKNKAVITSSTVEVSKEDSQSVEDFNDKFSKSDQADSKSIDSSRSTEDEDEEEVETARTAAINQEIKRILTEVLLKVTDELFDEIATRVLNEDDLSVGVGDDIDLSNDQPLTSTQATLTPNASAKILIPTKAQEVNVNDASENSISSSAGDVLGLGSYASDEEDDEIQNSGKLKSKESFKHLQSSSSKDLEDHPVFQNGSSRKPTEEQSNDLAKLKTDVTGSKSAAIYTADYSVASAELNNTRNARESASGDNQCSSKRPFFITGEESQRCSEFSKSNKSLTEKAGDRNERPGGSLDAIRSANDNFQTRSIGNRHDKNDGHENQKSSSLKNVTRSGSVKERPEKKVDEESRSKEEGHTRVEKTDYLNGSKDKRKDKGRTDEKTKDSDSKKRRSPADANEGASRSGRDKIHRDKEETDDRRRDKTRDEKKERSRHDTVSDSGRRKRHMSPSVDGKEKESKDNSVSHANDYSDKSSDDSKLRVHQSRRHKSPSPIRQRKRQVSRSPHSKHSSKRRHSPSYSSLEATRGKRAPSRSRSRSPVHRRR